MVTHKEVSAIMSSRLAKLFRRLPRHQQRTITLCAFTVTKRDLEDMGNLFR